MGVIASIVAGTIVIALLFILLWVRQGKSETQIPKQPPTSGFYPPPTSQYGDVPSAPLLPDMQNKWK